MPDRQSPQYHAACATMEVKDSGRQIEPDRQQAVSQETTEREPTVGDVHSFPTPNEELGEELARCGIGATFSCEGWVRLTFFPEGIVYEIRGSSYSDEVEVRKVP